MPCGLYSGNWNNNNNPSTWHKATNNTGKLFFFCPLLIASGAAAAWMCRSTHYLSGQWPCWQGSWSHCQQRSASWWGWWGRTCPRSPPGSARPPSLWCRWTCPTPWSDSWTRCWPGSRPGSATANIKSHKASSVSYILIICIAALFTTIIIDNPVKQLQSCANLIVTVLGNTQYTQS